MSPHEIVFLEDEHRLAVEAAATVVDRAMRAFADHGAFRCALSGGATPRAVYRQLADLVSVPPLDRAEFFFGDERCAPPSSPHSNYRLVRETLLERAPSGRLPRIFRMEGENPDRDAAAAGYERVLRAAVPGDPPALDLVLLGIGTDGHTASLFPGSPLFDDAERRMVAAVRVPASPPWRLTLTPAAIRAARERLFLVTNPAKVRIVAAALREGSDLPAARVGPARWLLAPAKSFRPELPPGLPEARPVS